MVLSARRPTDSRSDSCACFNPGSNTAANAVHGTQRLGPAAARTHIVLPDSSQRNRNCAHSSHNLYEKRRICPQLVGESPSIRNQFGFCSNRLVRWVIRVLFLTIGSSPRTPLTTVEMPSTNPRAGAQSRGGQTGVAASGCSPRSRRAMSIRIRQSIVIATWLHTRHPLTQCGCRPAGAVFLAPTSTSRSRA